VRNREEDLGSEELGSPSQGGTPLKRSLDDTSEITPPGDGKRKHKKRRTIRDILSSEGSEKDMPTDPSRKIAPMALRQ
ncbi:hypothetical protein Bbelb_041990, partial [Branchiostoma belcheri]